MISARYLSVVFVFMLMSALGNRLATADQTVSKTEALKAIDTFQKDPSSKEGFAAAATFMAFAQKSPLVHISLSRTSLRGSRKTQLMPIPREILLNAYVAGNLEAQLKSGKAVDSIYAGWEQVLTTYAQLLHINSRPRSTKSKN